MKVVDMIGQTYGRLTVLELSHRAKKKPFFKCKCICGAIKIIDGYNIRSGNTSSCGCLHRDVTVTAKTTHGMSLTAEYRIWSGILARCTNPNRPAYPDYGGRGITVCNEWRHSFESFLSDMGERPFPDAEIDRIDNDKGYEPTNCRWATPQQNANNKRTSRLLSLNGETMTMAEWSNRLGVKYQTLDTRRRAGWTDKEILTTPIMFNSRHHKKLQPRLAAELAIKLPFPEER